MFLAFQPPKQYNPRMVKSEDLDKLSINELWALYSKIVSLLKEKGGIRSGNITGDRGESLAIEFYNSTPGLPNLQAAPKSTENIDAISNKGERYTIKTIKFPNRTTGVFYGLGSREKQPESIKFEYLTVVVINDKFELEKIIELDWNIVIKYKKWHSRMNAYNISLSQEVLSNSRVLYSRGNL